jgi:O-methyltransferase/methyltransferase family protein
MNAFRWRMLLTPRSAALIVLMTLHWPAQALYVAAKLGIADLLRDGPKTVEELARDTATDATSLRRLLRALACIDIFAELPDGRFKLTRLAERLRVDHPKSMRSMVLCFGEPWNWRPFGELLRSVETGAPAFDHVYGKGLFEFLSDDPEAGAIYDSGMTALATEGQAVAARAYDYKGIETVVDVGGGRGTVLAGVLEANPHLRGVLFDQPAVVARARERLSGTPLGQRCTPIAGDFFESVPEGADAYLLSTVIHDWDDERASLILRNCRRAMSSGARLLLAEAVVPPLNEYHFSKHMDLEIMVMYGGRERTEAEYRRLLAAEGFEVTQVLETVTPFSLIEAVPD